MLTLLYPFFNFSVQIFKSSTQMKNEREKASYQLYHDLLEDSF